MMMMMTRRKMKYLSCLMSHYETNLSSAQNVISSCDPTARLNVKRIILSDVCDLHVGGSYGNENLINARP
jgi:hypothetical protein